MENNLRGIADLTESDGLPCEAKVLRDAADEIERLQKWVNDLQSGMYINCVYCGHRYGPQEDTPTSMRDVLRKHIEQCPKHPLSEAMAEIERLRGLLSEIADIGEGE